MRDRKPPRHKQQLSLAKIEGLYRMALSSAQTTLAAPASCHRRGCREAGRCLAYADRQYCGADVPDNMLDIINCSIAFVVWLDQHGWRLDARARVDRKPV